MACTMKSLQPLSALIRLPAHAAIGAIDCLARLIGRAQHLAHRRESLASSAILY